jgi:hypothetical protein
MTLRRRGPAGRSRALAVGAGGRRSNPAVPIRKARSGVRRTNPEAIERHLAFGRELPTLHSTMHLHPIDGAAHDVGETDTAFSYRDANRAEVIVGLPCGSWTIP